MKRLLGLALVLCIILPATGHADDVEFRKSKQIIQNGDESDDRDISLVFTDDDLVLRHRNRRDETYARIPYDSIDSITYERSEHPRTATAILISPFALFSSSKKHWLTVTYRDGDEAGFVLMQLDKNEQQQIVATATTRTGVEVERIIED